jgi:hypothetical protein
MSTLKTNNVQVGQSVTATNNFTLYQPATPDGTVRLGVGNSGATTADVITATSAGNVGIGTSSPQAKLHVAAATVSGTVDRAMVVANSGASGTGSGSEIWIGWNAPSTAGGGVTIGGVYPGAGSAMTFSTAANNSSAPTERARIDSSGNWYMNSGYGSAAVAYGCRAWVNFNGTGTVAIRASGNVSSITDNGTGDYTVNFTNAMPDANYTMTAQPWDGTNNSAGWAVVTAGNTYSASSIRLHTKSVSNQGNTDIASIAIAIFR